MTVLDNPRYECFARLRAEGKSGAEAAIGAGYSKRSSRTQGARLFANDNVRARISELQAAATTKAVDSASLNGAYVINGLCEIAKTCGDPTAKTWRPQAAIRALELLGKTLGLWIVRVEEHRRVDDWQSAEELDAAVRAIRSEIEDLEDQRARKLEDADSQ
jgi:hypothetical protein